MLQVKLIIEIEEEFVKMGYTYGVEDLKAGWVHESEPFVRIKDQAHYLKDLGKLKYWKCNKFDDWTEVKKRVKQK
tara:strand:- start:1071 stop:1295 length:225 start_codon:yes stop_codon:yes gene_type:complete